ncbi:hypothetical protein HK100_001840 [Physocladia obscura]|uniref:Uncharacterized protein n=1 Tax=Physocladia obscura TaxID=109957 RepID=A0AAD5SWN1_9FUNG|nr:hypothetical protein HK100_001840 [Physocladia obscura]
MGVLESDAFICIPTSHQNHVHRYQKDLNQWHNDQTNGSKQVQNYQPFFQRGSFELQQFQRQQQQFIQQQFQQQQQHQQQLQHQQQQQQQRHQQQQLQQLQQQQRYQYQQRQHSQHRLHQQQQQQQHHHQYQEQHQQQLLQQQQYQHQYRNQYQTLNEDHRNLSFQNSKYYFCTEFQYENSEFSTNNQQQSASVLDEFGYSNHRQSIKPQSSVLPQFDPSFVFNSHENDFERIYGKSEIYDDQNCIPKTDNLAALIRDSVEKKEKQSQEIAIKLATAPELPQELSDFAKFVKTALLEILGIIEPTKQTNWNETEAINSENLSSYIENILQTTDVSPGYCFENGTEKNLVIFGLMLANKILDDHTFTNRTWSDVSKIPLEDLNTYEIRYLNFLNHSNFIIAREEFSDWIIILQNYHKQRKILVNQVFQTSEASNHHVLVSAATAADGFYDETAGSDTRGTSEDDIQIKQSNRYFKDSMEAYGFFQESFTKSALFTGFS